MTVGNTFYPPNRGACRERRNLPSNVGFAPGSAMNDQTQPAESAERPLITIHGPAEFESMRKAGRLAAETLDFITPFVTPGVTTAELDRLCAEFTEQHGAISAPLNYRGFPKSICTSVNHVVCHGIPGDKSLRDGDIINIDVTPIVEAGTAIQAACIRSAGSA